MDIFPVGSGKLLGGSESIRIGLVTSNSVGKTQGRNDNSARGNRITRGEVVENKGQQGDWLHNQAAPSSDTSERTFVVLGASIVSASLPNSAQCSF